jgi:hypothetical protein
MYSVGLAASVEALAWLKLLLSDAARVLVDPACVPFSICMPDTSHALLEKSPHAIDNCVKTYIPRIRIYKSQSHLSLTPLIHVGVLDTGLVGDLTNDKCPLLSIRFQAL